MAGCFVLESRSQAIKNYYKVLTNYYSAICLSKPCNNLIASCFKFVKILFYAAKMKGYFVKMAFL